MSRWADAADVQRGPDYDARWSAMAAAGENPHGEADCIMEWLEDPSAGVLDAGCGTGRVAIELARRGVDVVGVDLDPAMLATARDKAPDLRWVEADLRTVDLGRTFGLVALAGNVMIFVAPGTEPEVVANLASHLDPGGLLLAGFEVAADRLPLAAYDAACSAAGLDLIARSATWDGVPYDGGDYAVSIHRAGRRAT